MTAIDSLNNLTTSKAIFDQESSKIKSMNNASNTEFQDQLAMTKKAKELEHIFVSKMVGILFEEINLDPLAKENTASEIYKSMLVENLSKEICKGDNFGIAKMIEKQLTYSKKIGNLKEGTITNEPRIDEQG